MYKYKGIITTHFIFHSPCILMVGSFLSKKQRFIKDNLVVLKLMVCACNRMTNTTANSHLSVYARTHANCVLQQMFGILSRVYVEHREYV